MIKRRPSAKILVQTQKNGNEAVENESLNVKIPLLVKIAQRRKSKVEEQEIQFLPIAVTKIVSRDENNVENKNATLDSGKPRPPALPFRLTLKSRRVYKGFDSIPWIRHNKVKYLLGFNSRTVSVLVETTSLGLRRVKVDREEVVRQKCHAEWSFTHFVPNDQNKDATHPRLGTVLKVIVMPDQTVKLLADGFPVENLRRSSKYVKGSPPPPPMNISNEEKEDEIVNVCDDILNV